MALYEREPFHPELKTVGAQIHAGHLEQLLPVLNAEGIAERADHLSGNARAKAGDSYQRKIEDISLESRESSFFN